jgi:hypothetical protein
MWLSPIGFDGEPLLFEGAGALLFDTLVARSHSKGAGPRARELRHQSGEPRSAGVNKGERFSSWPPLENQCDAT